MLSARIANVRPPLAASLVCVLLACLVGIGFAQIIGSDLRWAIALTAATVFLVVLLVVPDPRRLLWIFFIFSFQLQEPSVRLLYGHAGSDGILITLPAMLGALYLLVAVASGRMSSYRSAFKWIGPVGIPLITLLGLSVVSLAHSEERFLGISNIAVQLQVYFVYLLALNGVRSEEEFELTLKVLYAALAIQCLIYFAEIALNITYISLTSGVVKATGPYPARPGGTLGTNPFSFTNFALPILFILFATIIPVHRPGTRPRWKSALLVCLGMVAIGLTLTRTAYANLLLGLVCIVVLGYRRHSVSTRKIVGMLLIVVGIAAATTPLIMKRLEREPMKSSYDERAALMDMAINVIEANPSLGVGPGAYEATYKHYITSDLEDKWQWMVHNHYLLRMAEVGLLGGVVLVSFLIMAWRASWLLSASAHPTVRAFALASAASVITTAHQMYWDQWTHVPAQMLLLFLLGLSGAVQSLKLPGDIRPTFVHNASVRRAGRQFNSSNPLGTEVG